MSEPINFKTLWHSYGRIVLTLCIAALVVHDVFGTHGYLALRRTKDEIVKVQMDLARLNRENAQLAEEVQALRTDPNKIESIARDGLGLAKPGEVIIKIPQEQQKNPQAKP
ncbi:MAG TPA: septum formation initiator family protein [Candidatus Dormibacteraeota bacterium]|jgi:cell division protein FtsB|nr:septum formation initiator family protein [Candidatus Dormibacteraeota bacterium]